MRSTLRLLLPAAAALALCAAAPHSAAAQQTVTCESRGYDRSYCNVDTRGGVSLRRNLSSAACVQNRTWGTSGRGIWVSNGCRAEFVVGNGYNNGRLTNRGNVYNNGRRVGRNRDVNGNGNLNGNSAASLCREAAASRIGTNVGNVGIVANSGFQNSNGGWHLNWTTNSRLHGVCQINRNGAVDVTVQR